MVREVKIRSSGETVGVKGRFTCKSNGGGVAYLYCLTNTKTGLQYAGVSGREQPVERFREHRRSIENGDKTVGSYFLRKNSSTADLTFTPFLSIKSRDPYVTKHLEREFLL